MIDAQLDVVEAVPVPPGGLLGRGWFAWACLAVFALSLGLSPASPTHGVGLCPFKNVTGLPCPGCGITRSIVSCGHGRLGDSFRYHPLGPIAWLAAAIGASSLAWPAGWRRGLRLAIRRRRRGLNRLVLLLVGPLTAFGVLRIVFAYLPPAAWWPWNPA